MSFQPRWSAALACLFVGVVAGAPAEAQAPAPRARPESPRFLRLPPQRFEYRTPRMTLRTLPLKRLDRGEFRLRALERSLDRMDRVRERQFALRDNAWRRQLETRERALSRVRERMGQPPKLRPFAFRRHLRTI